MTRVQTLADIAVIAGVTPATVSRALAGNPRISESTRERIVQIAENHGFRLNQTARNLRLGRTQAIGVVIPLGHESAQRVSDPFYTALIGRLMEGLARREHGMLLEAVTPHDENWIANLGRSGRIDGILVLCQSDQESALRSIGRSYLPMVVWGEAPAGQDYCCVGTDNRLGGRLATEHLLRTGRRNIAFAGLTDIPELDARHQGYRDAHEAAGVEPGVMLPVPLAFDPAKRALHGLLAAEPQIDAIFAVSDMIAMGAMQALADNGRRVPDDVAVVGYDDVLLASYVTPSLTTIRQDLDRAADVMLDLLFRRMAGERADSTRIPLTLVERDSA
ncbi:MAG: LacI family DNA-binding transcriptional regulator [Janthinobacterium lividum]